MRGDRKKQKEREKERREGGSETAEDVQIIDVRNYKQKRIPQLMWRECINKKKVIKKILIHLGAYREKHIQRAPPMTEPEYTEPEIVPFDDGWPEYKEAVIES